MSWDTLPVEIQLEILDLTPRRYACVSQEWRNVLEPKNFERMILFPQDSQSFRRIVRGYKRRLVKHIWLRVLLRPYTCAHCTKSEDPQVSEENNEIFVKAIKTLFQILATWEKPHDVNEEGLTLELCAYSKSDSKHVFRELNFEHNPYSEPCENFRNDALDSERRGRKFHNPWHLWRHGRRHSTSWDEDRTLETSQDRIRGHGLYIMPPNHYSPPKSASGLLSNVEVVTKLLFRRQYRRYIHPDCLCQLLECLTGLQHIIYEPERICYSNDADRYEMVIDSWLPRTLKQLTIFETRNEKLDWEYRNDPSLWIMYSIYSPRIDSPRLGVALAKASRNLETLSTSFFVEAKDFLRSFWPRAAFSMKPMIWTNMKSIALTSALLAPEKSPVLVNELLEAASNAARSMPLLHLMEIWNGRNTLSFGGKYLEEHGCIFRYCNDARLLQSGRATIIWHSTWQLNIASRVIESWTKTAHRHGSYELEFKTEQMVKDGTRFPTSVLRHLKLRSVVVDPISYRQIQLEGELHVDNDDTKFPPPW